MPNYQLIEKLDDHSVPRPARPAGAPRYGLKIRPFARRLNNWTCLFSLFRVRDTNSVPILFRHGYDDARPMQRYATCCIYMRDMA
jgi:hypothetical protein